MALLPELWPVGGCGDGAGPSDGRATAQHWCAGSHCLQLSSFPTAASQTTLGFRYADLGLGGSRKAEDTRDTIRELTAEEGKRLFSWCATFHGQQKWASTGSMA